MEPTELLADGLFESPASQKKKKKILIKKKALPNKYSICSVVGLILLDFFEATSKRIEPNKAQ